jgi:hypothetical protein
MCSAIPIHDHRTAMPIHPQSHPPASRVAGYSRAPVPSSDSCSSDTGSQMWAWPRSMIHGWPQVQLLLCVRSKEEAVRADEVEVGRKLIGGQRNGWWFASFFYVQIHFVLHLYFCQIWIFLYHEFFQAIKNFVYISP